MTTSSPRRQRRRPARSQQRQQRQQGRAAAQRHQTDYAQDYAFVRRDMRRIAIWSILLFAGMFGAYFFI